MNDNPNTPQNQFENRIFFIRSNYIMLDRDLAEIYQVETKALNQAVKRNSERFPVEFRFQLSLHEKNELVTSCDRLENLKHSSTNPFAFTEQGVAMLSAVLRSDIAVKVSVEIIKAFVEMRKTLQAHRGLLQRMDSFERRQLENEFKFEKIFKALESNPIPTQGLFFDGQLFDAYELASQIIRSAQQSIVLIDNYIDESVLVHLAKKSQHVNVLLLSKNISRQLLLDVQKAQDQ